MSRTTPELQSNPAKRLSETSVAFDRFHRFIALTQTDLLGLKKTFNDVSDSVGRFNSVLGSGDALASAKETASIRGKSEAELVKSERQRQQDQLDNAINVGEKLRAAFKNAGDDLLGDLVKGLQFIRQMAAVLKSSGSGDGILDGIPFLGNLSSLFSLFDEGGYTGNIPGNKAAGIVHGGEIVFEKPIVDQHLNELMALRRSLQQGNSLSNVFRGTNASSLNYSMSDLNPLISEIRLLRSENKQLAEAVKGLEIQAPVVLQGTLSGQQFLRKEMPSFESYNTKKKV
jgi:hypothetical protein